jgi:hypothetical protein
MLQPLFDEITIAAIGHAGTVMRATQNATTLPLVATAGATAQRRPRACGVIRGMQHCRSPEGVRSRLPGTDQLSGVCQLVGGGEETGIEVEVEDSS